jgi:hypothetical protein
MPIGEIQKKQHAVKPAMAMLPACCAIMVQAARAFGRIWCEGVSDYHPRPDTTDGFPGQPMGVL